MNIWCDRMSSIWNTLMPTHCEPGMLPWFLTCWSSPVLRRSPSTSMLWWLVLAFSSEMVCFCWEQWSWTSCREDCTERSFSSKDDTCSCCSKEIRRRRKLMFSFAYAITGFVRIHLKKDAEENSTVSRLKAHCPSPTDCYRALLTCSIRFNVY